MSNSPVIAYYITAHGYGHAVRSCDIINALLHQDPTARVIVVSDLPETFLRSRLGSGRAAFRRGAFDVGMVQQDPIRVQVPETLRRMQAVCQNREVRTEQECAFLEEAGVGVVVSDIPALPLAAASRNGVPGLAVGNFAWDWIYEAYVEQDMAWRPVVQALREGYARSTLLMRMPFAEPMSIFPNRMEVPLVACPGTADRERVVRLSGADPEKKWVLLSFSGMDLSGEALDRLSRTPGYEFFTILPTRWNRLHIHAVDREQTAVPDLLASVDVVLSKPGFGIVSECVVNHKPMIYVEREDFREYPILEAGIKKYLRQVHLPASRLYEGAVEEALAQLASAPEPEAKLESDQGRLCAETILRYAHSP